MDRNAQTAQKRSGFALIFWESDRTAAPTRPTLMPAATASINAAPWSLYNAHIVFRVGDLRSLLGSKYLPASIILWPVNANNSNQTKTGLSAFIGLYQQRGENTDWAAISIGQRHSVEADYGGAHLWSRWQALKLWTRVMYPTRSATHSVSRDPSMASEFPRDGWSTL